MQIKNLEGRVLREVPGDSLKGADLSGKNLNGADLRKADLRGADLRKADLSWADLGGANLSWADLTGADLRWADLSWAYLTGAHIEGAVLPLPIVPSEGEFTGYKKVLQDNRTYTVITLRIPADAERTSALASRKCRASHVIVVEGTGVSPTNYRSKLTYTPGIVVTADHFDSDRREECTNGIHFFLTLEEAEAY